MSNPEICELFKGILPQSLAHIFKNRISTKSLSRPILFFKYHLLIIQVLSNQRMRLYSEVYIDLQLCFSCLMNASSNINKYRMHIIIGKYQILNNHLLVIEMLSNQCMRLYSEVLVDFRHVFHF